jgi:hypothetical protein
LDLLDEHALAAHLPNWHIWSPVPRGLDEYEVDDEVRHGGRQSGGDKGRLPTSELAPPRRYMKLPHDPTPAGYSGSPPAAAAVGPTGYLGSPPAAAAVVRSTRVPAAMIRG